MVYHHDADAFKQLRSMILLELCCPPLPVMATRQETGGQTVTNTHDMLSVFLITAFNRQNEEENRRRKALQVEIERAYQDGLDSCCGNFTQTYAHMAQFITSYLATYLEGTGFSRQDIRVLPPDYISPSLKEEISAYSRALGQLAAYEDDRESKDQKTSVVLLTNDHDSSVDALFMSCVRSAIHKKQQRVVGAPVLVGVGEDIGEEGHDPQALEAGVQVL